MYNGFVMTKETHMKVNKDGSSEWAKKDRFDFLCWRAKELGLEIGVIDKHFYELRVVKATKNWPVAKKQPVVLLECEKCDAGLDHLDMYLMGYEWGRNSVAANPISAGYNNFPAYVKAKKKAGFKS
jgi:hypothetical protein